MGGIISEQEVRCVYSTSWLSKKVFLHKQDDHNGSDESAVETCSGEENPREKTRQHFQAPLIMS